MKHCFGFFLCFFLAVGDTAARDMPYAELITAVTEPDDERMFEVSSWVIGNKRTKEFAVNPEYNFSPWFSVGLELAVEKINGLGGEPATRERRAELEFRYLIQDSWRSGFAYGIAGSLQFAKEGANSATRQSGAVLLVPMSWSVAEKSGWLHLNLGVNYQAQDKSRFYASVGAEYKVAKRTTLFAELSARNRDYTQLHGGIRHWFVKDKFAFDASLGRTRPTEGERSNFASVGVSFYDLSF
jgi:hypothetical protein